jgi:hypothetical protein
MKHRRFSALLHVLPVQVRVSKNRGRTNNPVPQIFWDLGVNLILILRETELFKLRLSVSWCKQEELRGENEEERER